MKYLNLLSVAAVAIVMVLFAILVHETDFSKPRPPSHIYRGYFYLGFETLVFHSCDEEEMWWVGEHPPTLDIRYRQITKTSDQFPEAPQPLYIEFRGTVSDRGQYGHFNLHEREVQIDELLVADRVFAHDRQCKPSQK